MSVLLEDLLISYKYGLKNLYYMNSMDSAGEVDIDKIVDEPQKKFVLPDILDDEEDCDSCKI